MKLSDRVGASLRRAPYVWLALTLVTLVAFLVPVVRVFRDEPTSQPWSGWVALGLIVYTVALGLFYSSDRMARKMHAKMTDNRFATMLWSFGTAPSLFGFAGTAENGKGWPVAIGLLASAGLLTVSARQLAHGDSNAT